MTTVDEAIATLNSILQADHEAIRKLIERRIPCNQALADHPTVQVDGIADGHYVGMLGIINGLFGVDEREWGYIAAQYDDAGQLQRFIRTPEGVS